MSQINNTQSTTITLINEAGTVTANKKKLGKLLRTFRDDCTEFTDLNLATTTIEHAVGVGQLFIAFIELAEDINNLTVKTSERDGDFTDKQLGTLLLSFRDYVIAADIGDMSKATKMDDEMFGAEFINYFNNQAVCHINNTHSNTTLQDQIECSLIAALTELGFKDIRKTSRGFITTEDRPGVTPYVLRNAIAYSASPVYVQSVKRNHGRIGYYELHSVSVPAEVKKAAEQNMSVLKIVRPNGQEVEMSIGQVGFFMWSLLDDLYLAKGMKFIKKTIKGGALAPSKKKQLELAVRFLHVLGFETGEDEFSNDQVAAINSLLAAA